MLGPYKAEDDGKVSYRGNKLFGTIEDVRNIVVPLEDFKNRVADLKKNKMWYHLSKINHRVSPLNF